MIYFYSGLPGSGKSLHAARLIDQYHRQGKNVITNFDVNMHFWDKNKHVKNNNYTGQPGMIDCQENSTLSVDYLLAFADQHHKRNAKGQILEKQTLVVIDECQVIFNSRSWNEYGRQKWNIFFTQHRKFGFTIVLISQSKDFIDKQIRGLLEYDYEHRNVRNYKLFGKLLSFMFGGLYVVSVCWMSNGKSDHAEWFLSGKKYYDLYDSYKIFDTVNLRQLSLSSVPAGTSSAENQAETEKIEECSAAK